MIEQTNAATNLAASNGNNTKVSNYYKDNDFRPELQANLRLPEEGDESYSCNGLEDYISTVTSTSAPPRWARLFLDYNVPCPPEPPALVRINGVGISFRAGLTVISGAEKSGKSTLIRLILAAHISQKDVLGISVAPNCSILLFDTEQPDYRILHQIGRAFSLAEKQPDSLKTLTIVRLRDFSPEERFTIVKETVADLRPDFAIIDGAADLANNPNDLEESEQLVSDMLNMTEKYNCCLVAVIHTNPNSPDGKIRGHLGSALMRKCETDVHMQRSKGVFTASCKLSRGRPFDKIAFEKTDDDNIIEADVTKTETTEKKPTLRERIKEVMQTGVIYDAKSLGEKLGDGTLAVSIRATLSGMADAGEIEKTQRGKYKTKEK